MQPCSPLPLCLLDCPAPHACVCGWDSADDRCPLAPAVVNYAAAGRGCCWAADHSRGKHGEAPAPSDACANGTEALHTVHSTAWCACHACFAAASLAEGGGAEAGTGQCTHTHAGPWGATRTATATVRAAAAARQGAAVRHPNQGPGAAATTEEDQAPPAAAPERTGPASSGQRRRAFSLVTGRPASRSQRCFVADAGVRDRRWRRAAFRQGAHQPCSQ